MELVETVTLEELVRGGGPLPLDRVARMGLQLLDALTAAHGAGLVHGGVRPGNVLVLPGDRVELGEPGVPEPREEARLTGTGAVLGPPAYLAPEQARGGPCTPSSDLWSLGATLYHALEGRDAFEAASFSAVLAKILDGVPARPAHAGPLEPLLAALLHKNPAARPKPPQIRQALTAAAEPPAVPPMPAVPRPSAASETPVVPPGTPVVPSQARESDPLPGQGTLVTAVPGGPPPFEALVRPRGLVTETLSRLVWTLVLCAGALAVLASALDGLSPLVLAPFLLVTGTAGLARCAYLVFLCVSGLLARNTLEIGPRGIAFRRGTHSAGYTWDQVDSITVAPRGPLRRRALLLCPHAGTPVSNVPLLPLHLTGTPGRSPWFHPKSGHVALCHLDELQTTPETVERHLRAFAGPRWHPSA